MAVSFERYGRLYYLDPGDEEYHVGDRVLVPTDAGPEVAECVWAPEWVSEDGAYEDLPRCAGRASEDHLARDAANRRRRAEAKLAARRLIKKSQLPMKVVAVDYVDTGADFDELVVVYFTAPQRVDFRVLVGELARALRARIDLRQIGSRDAARMIGGLGNCGRDLCCATFLTDFEPVSLRMAKMQDLPPNPLKISGACGRLMCCLKYEHPLYAEFAREVPAVGERVALEDGEAVVLAHQVPADSVVLRMSASGEVRSCSKATVCGARQLHDARPAPPAACRQFRVPRPDVPRPRRPQPRRPQPRRPARHPAVRPRKPDSGVGAPTTSRTDQLVEPIGAESVGFDRGRS